MSTSKVRTRRPYLYNSKSQELQRNVRPVLKHTDGAEIDASFCPRWRCKWAHLRVGWRYPASNTWWRVKPDRARWLRSVSTLRECSSGITKARIHDVLLPSSQSYDGTTVQELQF